MTRWPVNMIDRRNYLPGGAIPGRLKGTEAGILLLYLVTPSGQVEFPYPGDGVDINDPKKLRVISRDYSIIEPPVVTRKAFSLNPEVYDQMLKNYKKNIKRIKKNKHYPGKSTVVICGAGPALKKDIPIINKYRDQLTLITLNRAQSEIAGDYFLCTESSNLQKITQWYKNLIVNGTTAHFANTIHPCMFNLPWKRVTFYSHNIDFEKKHNLPRYFAGRHVGFDAMQFAAKILKPRKLILTGFDMQDKRESGAISYRFLDAKLAEGFAFFLNRSGIKVWNVSGTGILANGVIIGTMEEAINTNLSDKIGGFN